MYRAAAKQNDYQLCGVLMAAENAGCRPTEMAHLLWKHIFLKENCMRYISSKATVAAEMFFTDQFREYLISLGDDHDPEDPVFPSYIHPSGEQRLSEALQVSTDSSVNVFSKDVHAPMRWASIMTMVSTKIRSPIKIIDRTAVTFRNP